MSEESARTDSRPNILFFMTDQLSALATSPYGNPDVITPAMQRLADRGVVFENAYCNAPLCAPSRASMMAGRFPSRVPVNDNGEEFHADVPTLAHHLRLGGYNTILAGKMHFIGPDQMHGFEERLTTDIYPADFEWTQQWDQLGEPPRSSWRHIKGWKDTRVMANMVTESGPVEWTAQLDYDEEVFTTASTRIRQLARRRGEDQRPWFMCVSMTQPHDPYNPTHEYWDKYENVEITMPEERPEDAVQAGWDVNVNSYHGVDVAEIDDDDVRRLRRSYYAMVTYIDDKLDALCAELERFGQLENTIIVLTSDHGDMLGENGMFFKRTFREWSSRVPLVFSGPGFASGTRVETPVSLVDLLPTLVEMATGNTSSIENAEGGVDGTSLMPWLRGSEPESFPPVTIEHNSDGTVRPTRTIIRGRHKYVHVAEREELLFDLEADPHEWKNVLEDPEYAEVAAELREYCLRDWDGSAENIAIRSSQRRRTFLNQALSEGLYTSWDYQPIVDAKRTYVRRKQGMTWDRSSPLQWDHRFGGR